jgi:sugar lactone lactonase YvrE
VFVPGTILVADRSALGGTGALIAVNPVDGTQRLISSGGSFANPSGVAVEAGGTILVADSDAFAGAGGLIRVNAENGAQSVLSQGGLLTSPFAVAIEAGGTIVVASGGGARITRVDPQTGSQSGVPPREGLESAVDVAVAPNGSILAVVDVERGGALVRLDRVSGEPVPLAGAEFQNPVGVAVEPDGIMWVVEDRHGVGPSLVRYDSTTGQRTLLTARELLRGPFRVAIEPGGNFVVSDPDMVDGRGRLVRVDRQTGAQSVLSAGGHFVNPFGIAVVQPA